MKLTSFWCRTKDFFSNQMAIFVSLKRVLLGYFVHGATDLLDMIIHLLQIHKQTIHELVVTRENSNNQSKIVKYQHTFYQKALTSLSIAPYRLEIFRVYGHANGEGQKRK